MLEKLQQFFNNVQLQFEKLLQFIGNPQNGYAQHSLDYIKLCAFAVALALAIALPLGILVARRPIIAFVATNLSGLARAIPSLAFLAAALPYLGVGFKPSVIALIVLGIPPILLNTVAGLQSVDPAVIDAARGMGMSTLQILWRIQLPLILPVIAAGVRTAGVQIVATATLAAIIGGGGWGEYILSGIYQLDMTQILAGALPVSLLALLVEVTFAVIQRLVTPAGVKVTYQQPAELSAYVG
jgi:osmoprotectant transport system permease protein